MAHVGALAEVDAEVATGLIGEARPFESNICHWLYVGDTALHLAAAGYRVEIVELLLAAGADRKRKTKDGKTAAELARQYGHVALAEELEK